MKENNKKYNYAMHKFVGVLDKYGRLDELIRWFGGAWETGDSIYLFIPNNFE